MRVETHLFVVLDKDGNPARAYRSREAAQKAVESDSYATAELTDVWPDVPLMEGSA